MRVALERTRPEDVASLVRALSHPDLKRWLNWPDSPEQIANEVLNEASDSEYAIRVDGQFAGLIRCQPEFGFWVVPELQGRGIAQRAGILALSRYFAAGHDRAFATTRDGNDASLAVLTRLGFTPNGPIRLYSQAVGDEVPGQILALTRADFARAVPFRVQTPRTEILPFTADDLPILHGIATAPEAARMLLIFRPGMEQIAFNALMTPFAGRPPFRAAVRLGDRTIGSIGVGKGEAPPIFYFLAADQAGKGIASEIVPAFCDELALRYGISGLTAEVMADNPGSARVLEKAGFSKVEAITMQSKGREGPAPGWLYQRDY